MSLSEEDRKILVRLQMEKARTFLAQADEMYRQKYWDIASNRYYYACFHAVQALLIHNGLSVRTHDGLITAFGLHFVKTGKVESRLGAFLSRMEQLREKGDYIANSPFLNIRRSSGAVPFVRNCAPIDAQEKFGGTLGTFQQNFRSGKMEKMGQMCAERYKKKARITRINTDFIPHCV